MKVPKPSLDLALIAGIIRKNLKIKLVIEEELPPLRKGGQACWSDGVYVGERLHWDQLIKEKYRAGFQLWQKVQVCKGPSLGFIGYVAAWHPTPDYVIILIQEQPGGSKVRYGFKPDELLKDPDLYPAISNNGILGVESKKGEMSRGTRRGN